MSGATSDITPSVAGRLHALQRAVEAVQAIAATHERSLSHDGLGDDDRAYLNAVIATARSIANRLRNSPGFAP